jgi:hypothetical protein
MARNYDKNEEILQAFEECVKGGLLVESNMKSFTAALAKHERNITDSDFFQQEVLTLKQKLVAVIDEHSRSIKQQVDDMVAAKEQSDTNSTADTATELRKTFGAVVASATATGDDINVAKSKAKVVAHRVRRSVILGCLDEVTSRYSI